MRDRSIHLVLVAVVTMTCVAIAAITSAGAQQSSSSSSTLITVGDPKLSGGSTIGTDAAVHQTAISELQRRLAAERENTQPTVPPAGDQPTDETSGRGLTLALVGLAAALVVVAIVVWPRRSEHAASPSD